MWALVVQGEMCFERKYCSTNLSSWFLISRLQGQQEFLGPSLLGLITLSLGRQARVFHLIYRNDSWSLLSIRNVLWDFWERCFLECGRGKRVRDRNIDRIKPVQTNFSKKCIWKWVKYQFLSYIQVICLAPQNYWCYSIDTIFSE